jgi:hypothetical protein
MECSICFDEMNDSYTLPCGHSSFCLNGCINGGIKTWIKIHNSCPLCRYVICKQCSIENSICFNCYEGTEFPNITESPLLYINMVIILIFLLYILYIYAYYLLYTIYYTSII